jgi:hypothetical protein
MKGVALSPRDGRALRRGAFVAIPVLAFQLVVRPVSATLTAWGDDVVAQRTLLQREQQLLQERASIDSAAVRLQRELHGLAAQLFEEPDEVTATAALATYVGDHAQGAGVLIQHLETRPAQPLGDGLAALEVVIRAESDFEGFLTLLRRMELGEKLVVLPALRIASVSGASPELEQPSVLSLSATLRGFTLSSVSAEREGASAKAGA